MKKLLAIMLTAVLSVAMVGCGNDAANNEQTGDSQVSQESTVSQETESSSQEVESSTQEEAEETVKVMSHEEFVAAAIDDPVVVETYVQAKQSWWEDKATIYTQAEDGAYFIYEMPCSQEDYAKLTQGTKIRVSGYKAEWSGEVEIIEASYEILEGNYIAEAVDATAWLGTDELAAHQNELVAFKGMTIEASKDAEGNDVAFLYNWDGSGQDGSDLYFNASVNGQTYTFTVESYLCDKTTDVYAAVKALEVGDVVDMEGFLYWYNGANPHITSVAKVQ
ncbi:MAG: hypothetical protein IKL04_02440 [Lachnospiraceae bacterium]|nr:hypothetical protein [Lachnospiraceae bacterium]